MGPYHAARIRIAMSCRTFISRHPNFCAIRMHEHQDETEVHPHSVQQRPDCLQSNWWQLYLIQKIGTARSMFWHTWRWIEETCRRAWSSVMMIDPSLGKTINSLHAYIQSHIGRRRRMSRIPVWRELSGLRAGAQNGWSNTPDMTSTVYQNILKETL